MTGDIKPMITKAIRLPYPHPGQQSVRRQARRFNWLSAGRRWRKTTLAMQIAVEAAVTGGTYLWGAPTFDQVRIGFNETRQAAADVADFNQSRMTVTFPGGGQIVYRSLDNPDNARGYTADGVIIDEVGDVKAAAWSEVLRPMLIDTNGWAWGIGTPRGRNWFWQEHSKAAADNDDSTISWQIPTLGVRIENGRLIRVLHPRENPDIPFSEIEHLFRTLPADIFRQEILAEFVENEGAVFRNIRACVADGLERPSSNHRYVMGVDWAQQHDFTVLIVMEAETRRVCALDRFNQIGWDVQRGRLAALASKWSVSAILAEENSIGGPNIEQLQREGLPVKSFTTTNQSKQDIMIALQLAFEREEIGIPDDSVLIGELEAYKATRLPSGRWRYEAPEGMHDDTVVALALAYEAANRPARISIQYGAAALYGSRGKTTSRGLYNSRR